MSQAEASMYGQPREQHQGRSEPTVDDLQVVCNQIRETVACYARERPEVAALACIGIGFVLGWKLKPW